MSSEFEQRPLPTLASCPVFRVHDGRQRARHRQSRHLHAPLDHLRNDARHKRCPGHRVVAVVPENYVQRLTRELGDGGNDIHRGQAVLICDAVQNSGHLLQGTRNQGQVGLGRAESQGWEERGGTDSQTDNRGWIQADKRRNRSTEK